MKDAFGGCPFQLGWTMFNYVGVDVQFELTQSSVKTNRIWHERDATLTSLKIVHVGVDVQFELTHSSVKTNKIWHERDATLTSLQIFILGTQMLPSVSSSVQNLTLKY